MDPEGSVSAGAARERLERALAALEAGGVDCQELRHAITVWVLAVGVEARGRGAREVGRG